MGGGGVKQSKFDDSNCGEVTGISKVARHQRASKADYETLIRDINALQRRAPRGAPK